VTVETATGTSTAAWDEDRASVSGPQGRSQSYPRNSK
jgi:hypothetical protein